MNTISSPALHSYTDDDTTADARSTSTALMAVRNLHKWYSGVHALKGVSLEFKRGEVVGLLGDNGAGKSTLIKILSGVHRPDEGEILFQGRPVRIPSPKAAMQLGIETIHQHNSLVPNLSIARNVFIGREPLLFSLFGIGPMDHARMRTEAVKAIADVDLHLRSAEALLGELSVAFFDTTSLYFEGRGGATLGQRGFSKDFRPQLHQVVLGIVLDGHERPIASFLWPGNTADVTTLLPVVERLRTRFGISRACVVADRGMISAATIAGLEAQGIDYILGVRERSTVEVRTTVIEVVPGLRTGC